MIGREESLSSMHVIALHSRREEGASRVNLSSNVPRLFLDILFPPVPVAAYLSMPDARIL